MRRPPPRSASSTSTARLPGCSWHCSATKRCAACVRRTPRTTSSRGSSSFSGCSTTTTGSLSASSVQKMGVNPSILVTLLNPLETDGLVPRERDPDDRRRHLVTLTPASARRLASASRAQKETEDALFASLAALQRDQLGALL